MFIRDELRLDASFSAARARLMSMPGDGSLLAASEHAYGQGIMGMARAGPPGSAPGLPRLARVRCRDLAGSEGWAGLALRWEALGPGGDLFPVLDADLRLSHTGERASLLSLAGTYRPLASTPGAVPGRVVADQAATMIRAFLCRVADAITFAATSAARPAKTETGTVAEPLLPARFAPPGRGLNREGSPHPDHGRWGPEAGIGRSTDLSAPAAAIMAVPVHREPGRCHG